MLSLRQLTRASTRTVQAHRQRPCALALSMQTSARTMSTTGPRVTKEMVFHELKEMVKLFLGGVAAVSLILTSSGFVIERTKAMNPMKPPGSLVNIHDKDGNKVTIHYQKQGQNNEIGVILDGGVGETSFDWEKVAEQVGRFATVIAIDRPGLGFSTPGAKPRTASQIAHEYAVMMEKINLPNKLILVGHGAGGYNMRELGALLEQNGCGEKKCEGLVLVDALEENLRPELESVSDPVKHALEKMDSNGKMVLNLARVGIIRLISIIQRSKLAEKYSPIALPYVDYYVPSPAHRDGALRENQAIPLTEQHFRDNALARGFQFPTVVLSHGKSDMFASMKFQQGVDEAAVRALEMKWQRAQRRLAAGVSEIPSIHIVVSEAGHNIHHDKPEEIVKVVRALLEEAKAPEQAEGLKSLQKGTCPV